MRDTIVADLSGKITPALVVDFVEAYEQLLAKHRAGDLEGALTKAGRFVEHTFRIIEFLRTGSAPAEIKQVAQTMQQIEKDTSISDSLRLLIPRAAYGLIYNLRSKRNAVHVKEIDPTPIDVSLTVAAASWIMAELLRLYHVSDDEAVSQAMLALSRTSIPLIEAIDGEVFVGKKVSAKNELLLLLAHAKPEGMSRSALGNAAKCSKQSVSNALKDLTGDRYVHLTSAKNYFITAAGEQSLANWITLAK